MAKYTCSCGARYKFPDSALGKRAKCKKCGEVFTLEVVDEVEEDGIFALADEPVTSQASHVENPVDPEVAVTQQQKGEIAFTGFSMSGDSSVIDSPALDVAKNPGKSFASDVFWTFLFPSTPSNLITFLIVRFALVIAPLAGCLPIIGMFLSICVIGWYCAFRMMVLASAAAGENNIPDVNISTDLWLEYIGSLFNWVGSWMIVLVPAFIYFVMTMNQSGSTTGDAIDMLIGGIGGALQGTGTGLGSFEVLVFMGITIWPMIILCISLGGFSVICRPDLIILTILKTFHVYAFTLLLIIGVTFLQMELEGIIIGKIATSPITTNSGVFTSILLLEILITGVTVYFEIVLMRLIGLYYYHFKHKFAWSWE